MRETTAWARSAACSIELRRPISAEHHAEQIGLHSHAIHHREPPLAGRTSATPRYSFPFIRTGAVGSAAATVTRSSGGEIHPRRTRQGQMVTGRGRTARSAPRE